MKNDETMFVITLDDYSYPRYYPLCRPYVGTRDDVNAFAEHLDELPPTQKCYADLIRGIKEYDTYPNAAHIIGGKSRRIMTAVEELYRRDFTVEDHHWTYRSFSGGFYHLTADKVWISQIVVSNERYAYRCSKAVFENLKMLLPGTGEVILENYTRGFPGIYNYKDGVHEMTLYIVQKEYPVDQREQAIADVEGLLSLDLTDVTRDLIGVS